MSEPNDNINQPCALELISTPTPPLIQSGSYPTQEVDPELTHVPRLEPAQDLGSEQHPRQTPGSGLDGGQAPGPSSSTLPTPRPGGSVTLPDSQLPQTLFLPPLDLFKDDRREDFFKICVPLYQASMEGDWKTVHRKLRDQEESDRPKLIRCSITENCETMLHVAVSSEHHIFVQKLVNIIQMEDLKLQNLNGNTALSLAAITGNTDIAKILVGKNEGLLTIRNKQNAIPLYMAVLYGKRDMVNYLYDETNRHKWTDQDKKWVDQNIKWVYEKCVEADLFDIALRIFEDHEELAKSRTSDVLGILAGKPNVFNETKQPMVRRIINSIIYFRSRPVAKKCEAKILLRKILKSIEPKPKMVIDNILRGPEGPPGKFPSRVLFVAAELGNTEFIVELIRKYPDLIWKKDDRNQSIFHIAVSHCHVNIYNLLYEIGSMKDSIVVLKDPDENNILHLVGKMPHENRWYDVTGAAFQLQHQLLWYKEVASMIPPSYRKRKNENKETPHQLFTDTHKDLVIEGTKWMKGTASKCMVVSALIVTIVFAVAYTIPGGYNEKDGFPVFLHNGPFLAFVILDAISLILSSTSILLFLSILTSRCAQEDFLETLPKTLMFGLLMLFLSIVAMMLSFSVSFFVLYRHKFIVVAIFISVLALMPIFSYVALQYPLFMDVYHSTYRSRYLFKPKKRMLYYQNPSV